MNVRCDECQSVFRVDPQKVPTGGVRARCSVCGGVIRVSASADGGAALAATPAHASSASGASGEPSMAPPPFAGAAALAPSTPPVAFPAPAPTGASGASFAGADAAAPVPLATAPPLVPPPTAEPAPPAAPASAADPGITPIWGSPNDVPALRHTPAADRSAVDETPRATPAAAQPAPGPTAPVGPRITPRITPAVAAGGGARRPINPYLNADPQQKARRLARALVSDIVAYHPQKREEGLRTGALKQLFREEIKKSYEEYVEQVGRELADSTTHFQDALNDVLAGGRRIF